MDEACELDKFDPDLDDTSDGEAGDPAALVEPPMRGRRRGGFAQERLVKAAAYGVCVSVCVFSVAIGLAATTNRGSSARTQEGICSVWLRSHGYSAAGCSWRTGGDRQHRARAAADRCCCRYLFVGSGERFRTALTRVLGGGGRPDRAACRASTPGPHCARGGRRCSDSEWGTGFQRSPG